MNISTATQHFGAIYSAELKEHLNTDDMNLVNDQKYYLSNTGDNAKKLYKENVQQTSLSYVSLLSAVDVVFKTFLNHFKLSVIIDVDEIHDKDRKQGE